ncbi:hypothetical protein Lal_00012820 [Lupinus albus]|nr:hypothetical protein Lal_00012820 [Lupinus albus]
MVHRVFPFARGLFEDKVANFWCAANVVIKLRQWPTALLQKAALGATLGSIIPPNIILFLRPRKSTLPLAFAATAWGFFLFSYQVHEKSVLLPLMPMTLLLAGKHGLNKDTRAWVGFANLLGVWTMFPLLKRVDLRVPYAVLTLLWSYLLGLPPTSLSAYFQEGQAAWLQWCTALLHLLFYVAMGTWHVLDTFVTPPVDKPDLWVVANVGIGAAGFIICYLWCFFKLIQQSDLLPGGSSSYSLKGVTLSTSHLVYRMNIRLCLGSFLQRAMAVVADQGRGATLGCRLIGCLLDSARWPRAMAAMNTFSLYH